MRYSGIGQSYSVGRHANLLVVWRNWYTLIKM
nr:MAG TPA: hypothetical protein [Caudoviricetes sp.]